MTKVFCSGSCRLLTSIRDGRGVFEPIHSMFYNLKGINFLGKLHNTKQHIQFIRWINDDIVIPDDILCKFLTSYSNVNEMLQDPKDILPIKKQNIKDNFYQCCIFIFEICSLKLYKYNNYDVQHELTDDYEINIQTEKELMDDLFTIRNIIPIHKKILFQTHFRPNIIYTDNNLCMENREIIYNTIKKFCEENENTYIYDPSELIKENNSLLIDDMHWTTKGHSVNFKYIYDNYIK